MCCSSIYVVMFFHMTIWLIVIFVVLFGIDYCVVHICCYYYYFCSYDSFLLFNNSLSTSLKATLRFVDILDVVRTFVTQFLPQLHVLLRSYFRKHKARISTARISATGVPTSGVPTTSGVRTTNLRHKRLVGASIVNIGISEPSWWPRSCWGRHCMRRLLAHCHLLLHPRKLWEFEEHVPCTPRYSHRA